MSIVYGDVCRLIVYYATKPFIRIIVIGNIITTKNKCNPNYPKRSQIKSNGQWGTRGTDVSTNTHNSNSWGTRGKIAYIVLKEFKKKMGDKCSRVNHL